MINLREIFSASHLNRRVNFVWFIDTARTRSISISIRTLFMILLLIIITGVSVLAAARWMLVYQRRLKKNELYVLELKEFIVHHILSDATSIKVMPTADSAAGTDNKQAALVLMPKTAISPQTLKVEKGIESNINTKTSNSNVVFEKVEITATEDSKTLVSFDLIPSSMASKSQYLGRVCVVAYSKATSVNIAKEFSFPLDFNSTTKGCPNGLLVKFSKKRPTDIILNISISNLARVGIRYEDMVSHEVYANDVDLLDL